MYLTTTEIKDLLGISDCHLMHERVKGNLEFVKKGSRFLYKVDDITLVKKHDLAKRVINWYEKKHDFELSNFPETSLSVEAIATLLKCILIPIEKELGTIFITYGFVSGKLNTFIQKNNPVGTSPSIDQHSSHEHNAKHKVICKRGGVASDFYVTGYEKNMDRVVDFIVNNLEFDRIYYYGKDRPIHVSVSHEMHRHLQLMSLTKDGKRIPSRKAYGDEAIKLIKDLL
ncbi:hypothetical protein [Thalassotalea maritima]|uniref:hypothetical protein n=1 Tax=Thalassotalea maritima TaxID=3242416 RepID=UPI0035297410